MKESWDSALKFVMFWEGGYVNDPNDPGGETKYGISKRAYPNLDIKNLDVGTAETIYKSDYWNVCHCDSIPHPMDIVVFNIAVNQGSTMALKIYSYAADWRDALLLSQDRYDDLKGFKYFGRGWSRRVVSLRDYIASNFTILEMDRKEFVVAFK